MVCVAGPADADDVVTRPLSEALIVQRAECLETESLARAVTRWLGQAAIDRRISISVRKEGDAIVYGLHRDDVLVGQRTVTSLPEGCVELTTALALSIAVAIEATFFGGEEADATPADRAPARPPSAAVTKRARASPPRRPSRGATAPVPHAVVTGELGLLWNTLPGVRPLASAGVDVAWSRHLVTRTAVLATTAVASPLGTGEVETSLYAGRADACGIGPTKRLELRACLGLAWGFVPSRGVGFLDGRSRAQPWLGLPLRGEGRLVLGRDGARPVWGIVVATDLIFSLRRAQMGVVDPTVEPRRAEQHTAVLTLPLFGAAASLGFFSEL